MIKFNKIENGEIFTRDFRPLVKHNEIDFPTTEAIAVIYGPNGTGKTSLIKVLSDKEGTKIEYEYNEQKQTIGKSVFHIINDQNNRNIIRGDTKDFFLGDNIKREFELQEFIISERANIISAIVSLLKTHGISAANSPLIDLILIPDIAALIKDIANKQSQGKKHTTEDLIAILQTISVVKIQEFDEVKLQFLKNDITDKDSIIRKIEGISAKPLTSNPHVHQIEENTEAISILNRFHKDQCIVCDTTDINWETLLASKIRNKEKVIEALSEDVKNLIAKIINLVPTADPFQIKPRLVEAISQGDNANIITLLQEVEECKMFYYHLVLNDLSALISASELPSKVAEYQALIDEKPEITQEDMLYIEEIISNSMRKSLTLKRDENKNLKIMLSDREVLGKSREELPLSTGEQNFLSLTFEFLKAKNSAYPLVVIDDPVSSFDSIYKNKVVYAIVKMLHSKKRIVLTHNTDLLRLLDSQYSNCYKLYLLNNTDGEENGFIALNDNEQEMLISLEKLLSTFRNSIFEHIKNIELFLISMVPFMRGYANITNNVNAYGKLTQLMHGYKTDKVDVAAVYISLFGNKDSIIPNSYEISVADILSKTVDGVHILDQSQYPVLDKTLRHSFTYLFLRLMVEKKLVDKFNINTNKHRLLGQIINAAYPNENDIAEIRNRIRLTSKKTLINEFNHFEGNLSIFQPAIDITDQALGKERTDIVTFVSNL
ncbi:MAG: AAA family ATPase [Synergistaceae bacterium]|nr:AAA family ATPase [Synergistaceae bacterium]